MSDSAQLTTQSGSQTASLQAARNYLTAAKSKRYQQDEESQTRSESQVAAFSSMAKKMADRTQERVYHPTLSKFSDRTKAFLLRGVNHAVRKNQRTSQSVSQPPGELKSEPAQPAVFTNSQQASLLVSQSGNDQGPITTAESNSTSISSPLVNTSQKLDILDKVLTEIEGQQPRQGVAVADQSSPDSSGDTASASSQSELKSQPQPQSQPVDASLSSQTSLLCQSHLTDLNQNEDGLGIVGQSWTGVVNQTEAQLEAAQVGGVSKETVDSGVNLIEAGAAGIQAVEQTPPKELPPEVEKYIQKVEDKQQLPQEVVVAQNDQQLPADNDYVSQPVVVLPITPEIEKLGKRKSPKFSIRWLIEWSKKIIKMFSGKVIYRQAASS